MKIGNFVVWRNCPGHLSAFARNQIVELNQSGDRARLRYFKDFIPVSELELVEPTEAEKRLCRAYNLPVSNDWDDSDFW
ncbi:hypothetical protein ACQ4M3_05250 [Leptolyngbya sp. AN03gr2]|uniref:hypothetical protein n=1 Tax=unclassified Leptolyngbya TaxID=2650499 RepID=UPI003D31378C